MLPDFKSKILTQLSKDRKEDGPTLFNLMGQFFQDIGLTEWTNVFAKQFPNETVRSKDNFDECIKDYLKKVAGFPNDGNQLICWLCTTKNSSFIPMHDFMWH
jgi:hypothetical protein